MPTTIRPQSSRSSGAVGPPIRNGNRSLLISGGLGLWGLCYAAYRGYYAIGGTAWIPGSVLDASGFRQINAIAALILLGAGVVPAASLALWKRRVSRRILIVATWTAAVGCATHAAVDIAQQIMSLNGLLVVHTDQAMLRLDPTAAAFQDIFFNEPWFLVEGVLFAALALSNVIGRPARWWLVTAIAGALILSGLGMLTALGVLPRVVVG